MKHNQRYQPEYPIIDTRDLLPRDQIKLVPELELSPIDRAELTNLRRGVDYRYCAADTIENREAIAIKTAYFQMVAHKEGWNFDSQKYQVRFVDPQHPLLSEAGTQKRIFKIEPNNKEKEVPALSPEGRFGVVLSGDRVTIMPHEETDGLARKLLKFVFG